MKKINRKKGFTIVELVIVIGVIGILSAILIPTFVNVTENAKTAALKSDLANAYSMYVADAADGTKDGTSGAETVYYVNLVGQKDILLEKGTSQYHFFNGEWKENTTPVSPKYGVAYTVSGNNKVNSPAVFGGYTVFSAYNTGVGVNA